MEDGIDLIARTGIQLLTAKESAYKRSIFFKLLNQRCDDLSSHWGDIVTIGIIDVLSDKTGMDNLTSLFEDASCAFGDHLGSDRSNHLEAAIAYYNFATQHRNLLKLIESDELHTPGGIQHSFRKPPYEFNDFYQSISEWRAHNWLTQTGDVHRPDGVSQVPQNGAYSFVVPAIAGNLPPGKVAELVVQSLSEVIVSITGSGGGFIDINTIGPDEDPHPHAWFSTRDETSSYVYSRTTVPEIFVTLVPIGRSSYAFFPVDVFFRIRDEVDVALDVDAIITDPTDGGRVSDRVVTVRGSIPEEAREATGKVVVTTNGIATETALNSDGSFAADVVIGFGDNSIKAQGFDDQETPVTNETGITIEGVASSFTRPNALIPSRVVFVLRWDTDRTDIDLHSTDGDGGHIYFARRTVGPGNLDRDDLSGFGPEVISYRETDDDVYVNGTFDVDVHYYSGRRAGSPPTNYTLDVILNESGVGDRRLRRFESITPLTRSDLRFNDILRIFCGSGRVCGLGHYDNTKLSPTGISAPSQRAASAAQSVVRSTDVQEGGPKPFSSAYEQCMSELETGLAKSGSIEWSCNPDGTKQWP